MPWPGGSKSNWKNSFPHPSEFFPSPDPKLILESKILEVEKVEEFPQK